MNWQALDELLVTLRAGYEHCKAMHNAGLCTFEQLENVRKKLEHVEATAAALPRGKPN